MASPVSSITPHEANLRPGPGAGAAPVDQSWLPFDRVQTVVCTLPGGYIADDGVVHREAMLRPLTGLEEEWLMAMAADSFAASIVTSLLTRWLVRIGSSARVTANLVRDLLVGDRDFLIVKLRELTFGTRVNAVIGCSSAVCGKPMDVGFSLADLEIEAKPATTRFFRKAIHSSICFLEAEFRLPTGRDQETLARLFHEDEAAAVDRLLARCVRRIGPNDKVGDGESLEMNDAGRREVIDEIERLAPAVVVELESACPECRTPCSVVLDFTTFFLAELRSA